MKYLVKSALITGRFSQGIFLLTASNCELATLSEFLILLIATILSILSKLKEVV